MAATRWTLRDAGPSVYERGVLADVRLLIYRDQIAVAGTGTMSLYDEAGVLVFTDPTVVASGTESVAAVPQSNTTDKAFSTRWREVWALTVAGETVEFRRDAWLVRSKLFPVVTVDDLTAGRHRNLADLVDGGVVGIEGYVVEAWKTIEADLIKKGKRPSLIMESWALRQLHIFRALHLCFLDAATPFSGDSQYRTLAGHYAEMAESEWTKNLRFEYDKDEDGIPDGQVAGSPVLILSAGRMNGFAPRMGYR